MARFFGNVGYVDTVDDGTGIHEEKVIACQKYYGEVINPSVRYRGAEQLNDNIVTTDKISILADPFAIKNFAKIRFVDYLGTLWRVENVSVAYPRLILSLGGVYNGPTDGLTEGTC